ncbi:MAG: hypothetical protein LBT59_23665 [Clostridiales bacterium]|jgi:hypothetical protein|nr:hypothetical protein [Clostridiales bacterium]
MGIADIQNWKRGIARMRTWWFIGKDNENALDSGSVEMEVFGLGVKVDRVLGPGCQGAGRR